MSKLSGLPALDAHMLSKMPLYRPEQLYEPGACLGCLERIFVFSNARKPGIYIDVTEQYPAKLAACQAGYVPNFW